jgi:hypothetical protein
MQRLTNKELDFLSAKNIPALLMLNELRELQQLNTPEPIGDKHRDGQPWLAYFPCLRGWDISYWQNGSWWVDRHLTHYGPTHALPLPEAPEPSAPRGEE